MLKSINWNNIDIITIAYGTNDYTSNKNYGFSSGYENSDYDCKYYGDALEYSITNIKEKYPNIKIFVCTPMYRWFIENDAFVSDCTTKTNASNALLSDYTETCKVVANKLGVDIINNYNELGINSSNYYNYFTATDGTHPSIDGRILVAENIASHITGSQKNYSKKYAYLKLQNTRHISTFFSNSAIKCEQILSLDVITNSVEAPIDNPDYSWSVSLTNNNSIMMYLYEDETSTGYYNAYMCSNSEIYTPNNASYMFSDLTNIISLDITGINTEYSNDMSYMFFNCAKSSNISSLNLGDSFDTRRVTDMQYMFSNCAAGVSSLNEFKLGDKFITNNVNNVSYMFSGFGTVNILNLGPLTIPSGAITTSFFSTYTGEKDCKVIVSNNEVKSIIESMWSRGMVEVSQ